MPSAKMAFLLSTASTTTSLTFAVAARHRYSAPPPPPPPPFFRLCSSSISNQPTLFVGYGIQASFVLKERVGALIAKASADVDGTGSDGPELPSGSEEEEDLNVPMEDLPLESKLQLKLEQKMRMKLAKKIRLRRKKLVRKRRLRKRGRWPPSKLKKNKNV